MAVATASSSAQGPSWKIVPGASTLASIESLEKLLVEKTLSGERFGSVLRELIEPEILVLSILLRDGASSNGGPNTDEGVRTARAAMENFDLPKEQQQTVEFLLRNQSQMSQTAFRRDTNDPDVIRKFASIFSSEEQLKMLCLMTVADASAAGGAGFTPWKAELLWRLFVDAYNHLTMAYADEIIDEGEAARTTLQANRPPSVSEAELSKFLEGFPRRYLTLFDTGSIYRHVELCRDLGPADIRFDLKKRADLWELTVVTLDRPYLFSNICGVLSYLDLDILRGHALTSLTSVVIDVFQFIERSGALTESHLETLLSDVVSGRIEITALLREKERPLASLPAERTAPVIYFDNDASRRYSVLELVAEDSTGLLYRISRALSGYGCSVELVLISTEGRKAVDVFHLKKGDAKLTDSDQLSLTEKLEEALR
jgi:[protein-PII] uridylyltransferase